MIGEEDTQYICYFSAPSNPIATESALFLGAKQCNSQEPSMPLAFAWMAKRSKDPERNEVGA